MVRFSIKKGDLLRDNRTQDTWVAETDVYTKRFMDDEDHEMAAHGMGEYAGIYAGAVRVVNTSTGLVRVWRIVDVRSHILNITAESEADETVN